VTAAANEVETVPSGLVMVACIGGIDLADYGRAKFDRPGWRETAGGHSRVLEPIKRSPGRCPEASGCARCAQSGMQHALSVFPPKPQSSELSVLQQGGVLIHRGN